MKPEAGSTWGAHAFQNVVPGVPVGVGAGMAEQAFVDQAGRQVGGLGSAAARDASAPRTPTLDAGGRRRKAATVAHLATESSGAIRRPCPLRRTAAEERSESTTGFRLVNALAMSVSRLAHPTKVLRPTRYYCPPAKVTEGICGTPCVSRRTGPAGWMRGQHSFVAVSGNTAPECS
jgi:hypothetical protein